MCLRWKGTAWSHQQVEVNANKAREMTNARAMAKQWKRKWRHRWKLIHILYMYIEGYNKSHNQNRLLNKCARTSTDKPPTSANRVNTLQITHTDILSHGQPCERRVCRCYADSSRWCDTMCVYDTQNSLAHCIHIRINNHERQERASEIERETKVGVWQVWIKVASERTRNQKEKHGIESKCC